MDTPTVPVPSDLTTPSAGLSSTELEEIAADLESPDEDAEELDAADTPPPTPASSAPPAQAPTPTDPPSPASPDGPPAPPSPDISATETPFTFAVDKTDITIPGMTKGADGRIHLTEQAWNRLRSQHLANRQAFAQREQQLRQAVEQVRHEAAQQQTVEQARAQALLTAITTAAQQGDQAIYDLASGFAARLPQLQADADARYWRERAEQAAQRLQPIETQQSREESLPWLWESVDGYLADALQQPDLAGLDAERARSALKAVEGDLFYFDPGTRQWTIHGPLFKRELAREAAYAKREADLKAQVAAAAALTQRNQQALAPTPPPPAVSGKASAAPAPSGGSPERPRTFQEYQEHLRRLAREP